jgi:ectoine hydroxylase-related dioxygenase (phytanoyl-CoA dioxygenase family)
MSVKSEPRNSIARQAHQFQKNGYVYLGNVISRQQAGLLKSHAIRLWEDELRARDEGRRDGDADFEHYNFKGAHLYNSPRRTRHFDGLLVNEAVLSVIEEIFGCPAILSQTELRNPFKDAVDSHAYKWHRDGRVLGHHDFWIIAFWLLDDASSANGATKIKPGTQHSDKNDEEAASCYLEGSAGDVFLVHSNIFHRATINSTGEDRWLFLPTYNPWFVKPSMDYTKVFSRETFDSFPERLKQVFGYTSVVPYSEKRRLYTRADWQRCIQDIHFPKRDIND